MLEMLLNVRSYLDPMLVNRLMQSNVEAVVSDDMLVLIDNHHTLKLIPDSQFSSGDVVVVSISGGNIVASLKADVTKDKEKLKAEVKASSDAAALEAKQFIESEVVKVDQFLASNHKLKELLAFYDDLNTTSKVLYNKYRVAFNSKSGVELALLKSNGFPVVIQHFLSSVIRDVSVLYHLEYAYSPNENTGSKGKYHVVVDEALIAGRYSRKVGEPLCKTKNSFSGLSESHNHGITPSVCKSCVERMIRLANK
ncbi:hypothetical protein LMH73_019250 [Vibrio splendidus]|nr:hypothetical protein [Vibrio splendidus]MCC4880502.1 hypothetical protein [Vibrio splendidus]